MLHLLRRNGRNEHNQTANLLARRVSLLWHNNNSRMLLSLPEKFLMEPVEVPYVQRVNRASMTCRE